MHVVKLLSILLVDCYKYFLSSYRFICALPSAYLVKDKDIKSYLCFQILCLYSYPPFYNSTKLSNDILTNVSRRLRRYPPHQPQTVFVCEIMQPAAFLCFICGRQCSSCCWPFICVNLRYLRENIHISVLNQSAKKNPQCLSQISLIIADNPKNYTNHTNYLSLRNNTACCILSATSA